MVKSLGMIFVQNTVVYCIDIYAEDPIVYLLIIIIEKLTFR